MSDNSLLIQLNDASATLKTAKPKTERTYSSIVIQVGLARVEQEQKAFHEVFPPMELASYTSLLDPNDPDSSIQIQVTTCGDDSSFDADSITKTLQTAFLLAGLDSERSTAGAEGSSSDIVMTGRRKVKNSKESSATKAVPLQIDFNDTEDDDIIDEDNLLHDASNFLPPPPAMSTEKATADDCAGREPCADCTCGRADAANEKNTAAAVPKTSSCGKCGLGDAFRCASCPYLGKPAFKAGEEHLVLDLQDDL